MVWLQMAGHGTITNRKLTIWLRVLTLRKFFGVGERRTAGLLRKKTIRRHFTETGGLIQRKTLQRPFRWRLVILFYQAKAVIMQMLPIRIGIHDYKSISSLTVVL